MANLSGIIGNGEEEEENLHSLDADIHYANLEKFGTKCFFERSCSNADTCLIVQTLGKPHSQANTILWVVICISEHG